MKKYFALMMLLLSQYVIANTYCIPQTPCWPTLFEWHTFEKKLSGRLIPIDADFKNCLNNPSRMGCKEKFSNFSSPFAIEDNPWATQITGLNHAWSNEPSSYVVAANNANDIVQAVNFAKAHKLKLVIKGTGHDYLGRSNAKNSLLIWTHALRKVSLQEHFIPQGCTLTTKGLPAVTVEAGARWLDVYKKVSVENNRYVQGGGCTSVGAAGGFLQGGGFGSFSKQYGTGSAGLLEAEIVTADGKKLIANSCQHQDLFWALKGGGAGTFGVVTKVTLLTHPLPKTFGLLKGKLTAKSDDYFKELIRRFLVFYREKLNNEHWGEQVAIKSNNTIELSMSFVKLKQQDVDKLWQEFTTSLNKEGNKFSAVYHTKLIPGNKFWSYAYRKHHMPNSILASKICDEDLFWWKGNDMEVFAYLYYYFSRYIPHNLLNHTQLEKFVTTLYKASRMTNNLVIHFNKGQYGASTDALRRLKETSMNPELENAIGLIIIADGKRLDYSNIAEKLDMNKVKLNTTNAREAMDLIKKITPHAGTYVNESDYFESNWQESFWGKQYSKLFAIKQKYDPTYLFTCHHCVGSENVKLQP